MDEPYQQLSQVLVDKFGVGAEHISPDATLEELGLDSLGVAELFLNLQDDWGVALVDDADSGDLTLKQVVELAGSQR